jgi:colanic acid/amylovoran biosynthesis glycosyltransferase
VSAGASPRTVVYVIPAYPPAPSQPFVVNEMVEIGRAGHRLIVLPLYAARAPEVRHGTFAALRPDRVLPPRLVDLRTVGRALRVLVRHPARCLRVLAGLHRAAGANPWAHARVLAVTPKALAAVDALRGEAVEHVHAHFANQTADCAAIVGLVAGIPFSFTAHAYDIYSRARRLRNDTLAWKLRHAARALAVSTYGADFMRRLVAVADARRVATAYVGIPLDLFRWVEPRAECAEVRLLCVARLTEKKGVDVLLDACAVLRDRGVPFRCEIIGDGPLREALEARHARLALGRAVRLRHGVPQEEVAEALRDCDLFVMPCRQERTGDMDGIPTVFMEAMATGRPVVSCAISGIPELVRPDETGVLVAVDDPDAVADAVERLARDPALRLRLARAGRALVERQHDQERNARQVLDVLLEQPEAGC